MNDYQGLDVQQIDVEVTDNYEWDFHLDRYEKWGLVIYIHTYM